MGGKMTWFAMLTLVASATFFAQIDGTSCSSWVDCPANQFCSGGFCQECTSNADCGTSYPVCRYGACELLECMDDSDCQSGEFCDISDYKCKACPANCAECSNQGTNYCYSCSYGFEWAGGKCECPSGQVWYNGQCVASAGTC